MLGMKLAKLTARLKRRYGHEATEGVVVLEVPKNVGPELGLSNLREGDLFRGIGTGSAGTPPDLKPYGTTVDSVKSPMEMAGLIIKHGTEESFTGMVGFQYVCGPLHPSERGKVRQGRMIVMGEWENLKDTAEEPRPWLPEK